MKVTEDPIKEIVVHEAYRMSLQELVLQRVRPDGRPVMLYWCDGIAYSTFGLGEKSWDDEVLKGKYHFSRVCFAEMAKYEPMVEVSTDQFGGLKIPVIDNSAIGLDRELVKWLKSQGKAKK